MKLKIKQNKIVNHWTDTSVDNYLFRINSDFLEFFDKEEIKKIKGFSKKKIKDFYENPCDLTIKDIVKIAKYFNKKVSFVIYENECGPVFPEMFSTTWELLKKPNNFEHLKDIKERFKNGSNT